MPALLASMAIPRVFPSVRIAGRTYVELGTVGAERDLAAALQEWARRRLAARDGEA